LFTWANAEYIYGGHQTEITFTVSARYLVDTALSYLQATGVHNIAVFAPPDPFVVTIVPEIIDNAPSILPHCFLFSSQKLIRKWTECNLFSESNGYWLL